jgi:hypothetical protein
MEVADQLHASTGFPVAKKLERVFFLFFVSFFDSLNGTHGNY